MIRNPIPWPNGAKCACCITFDMDADSLVHIDHRLDGHKRVSAISMLQYGPDVAVPRIVDTYKDLGSRRPSSFPPGVSSAIRRRLKRSSRVATRSAITVICTRTRGPGLVRRKLTGSTVRLM